MKGDEKMDKYTRLNTINSMLGKKHKFTLQLSDATRALICECDPEQMHQVMFEVYTARNTSEDFVKKNIASIKGQSARTIGFSSGI